MVLNDHFSKKLLITLFSLIISFVHIPFLYASSLEGPDTEFMTSFKEMKDLLIKNKSNFHDLYKYSQANVDKLSRLSYEELGPVSAKALGDWFYEKESFDEALNYYEMIYKNSPPILADSMNIIDFNLSYTYSKKEKFSKAIDLLKRYNITYPDSKLAEQAVSLYYYVATNNYRMSTKSINAYRAYIDSLRKYIVICKNDCTDKNEVHYRLGRHYERNKKSDAALEEYLSIDEKAPKYVSARLNALKLCVKEMQLLNKKGEAGYKRLNSLHNTGVKLLREYRSVGIDQGSEERTKNEPLITLFEADLYLLKQDKPSEKVLKIINNFEKRFPRSSDLFLKVRIMRIVCYQDLGLKDKAGEEIDGIVNINFVDKKGFNALHDLAEKLFNEASITQEDLADRNRTNALMIYKKLYTISKLYPDYRKYRNPILFRMVRIYMSEGQLLNAIELYNNILKADLLSADEIYALGLLYERTGQWEDALMTWRRFSDGVRPGTDHWFETRYRTAVTLEALGRVDKACDILTVTLLLHPDMGNEKLTNKYIELKKTLCMGE